jgi:hypothetical protein
VTSSLLPQQCLAPHDPVAFVAAAHDSALFD